MYLARRTETFVKLFFLISCTGLFLYSILAFYTFHRAYTTFGQVQKIQDPINELPYLEIDASNGEEYDRDLKYILVWTLSNNDPAHSISEGQSIFTNNRCEFVNCFITTNKTMMKGDYKNFDAVVFNISVLKSWKKMNMPQTRSFRQKFIFYSLESPDETPICNINADNYFNWTWTYKLNSDIVSPFIEVTDLQGNIIAPKLSVKWLIDQTYSMEDHTNSKKKPKQKAMIWIMDKCKTKNNRAAFAKELQAEFKSILLDFDIYGCGHLECPKEGCLQEIKKYNFYLAYEDSIAEDYVTKEVTKGYNHGAIPVVLGDADYRRFLPDGSYINAQSMSPDDLAAKIYYIINHPYIFNTYFHWKKFYSIHETEEFRGICDLCAYLNDDMKLKSFSAYKDFRKWWYPGSLRERCIPKGAEDLAQVLSYLNSSAHL